MIDKVNLIWWVRGLISAVGENKGVNFTIVILTELEENHGAFRDN